MSSSKRIKKALKYPYHKNFTNTKKFKESLVYAQMLKIDIDVLDYIYGKLDFTPTKIKKYKLATNNGKIEVSLEIMAKNLRVTSTTCSNSVKRLVGWGLLEITRYGGNNVCHMYKVLINANPFKNESVCLNSEEKYLKWTPENNWNHLRASTPKNCTIGVATRFKKKTESLPNGFNGVTQKDLSVGDKTKVINTKPLGEIHE